MIDWARIAELRSEIGEDGLAEVVELFIDEMEEVVARLRSDRESASLESDLHFLMGGAWNLGFSRFGALCNDGERKAANGQSNAVDVPALLECYKASKQEFVVGIAARPSSAA